MGKRGTFIRGNKYSREQVQLELGLKPTKGGNWFTGYTQHAGQWFLFPNIGVAGRTGHNYGNHWEGSRLRWFGKTDTHLGQPAMKALLAPAAVVHLFTRDDDRDRFTYRGRVRAVESRDVSPVEVLWEIEPDGSEGALGLLPGEVQASTTFTEGATRQVTVNAYERNPAARSACLAHWGTRCSVCNLDMEERYGEIAAGFAHVHHLRALSEVGKEYQVDPRTEMRPVCPNCHAVIHMRVPALSIEEARAMLR